jgi:hypothetical protein
MSQRHASAIAWVAREVFFEAKLPFRSRFLADSPYAPAPDRQNRIATRDRAMEAEFRLELNFLQLLAVSCGVTVGSIDVPKGPFILHIVCRLLCCGLTQQTADNMQRHVDPCADSG